MLSALKKYIVFIWFSFWMFSRERKMAHKLSKRSIKRLWSHYQKNTFNSFIDHLPAIFLVSSFTVANLSNCSVKKMSSILTNNNWHGLIYLRRRCWCTLGGRVHTVVLLVGYCWGSMFQIGCFIFKAYRANKDKTHLAINQFRCGITAALFPGNKHSCFFKIKDNSIAYSNL